VSRFSWIVKFSIRLGDVSGDLVKAYLVGWTIVGCGEKMVSLSKN